MTERQEAFINAEADEVLFGGAAGGGKSFGQFLDAVIYAGKYPGSKQIIFRRTFPDLERSIIRTFEGNLPKALMKYNATKHLGVFDNGSIVDFGYLDHERDVYHYQSAEYDVIRFDELTHFTEEMYLYLMSRLRGANPFPKFMKSTTNPGGIGHDWVKKRFINPMPPNTVLKTDTGTRLFLPSKVQDNQFLMENDSRYMERLKNLPERERKALLDGDWDIFDGQYFDNFKQTIHVVEPMFGPEEFPAGWEYYIAIDYGLDMLAALLVGVTPGNDFYIINEFYDGAQHPAGGHKGLLVSEAAEAVKKLRGKYPVRRIFAPPDLWARNSETGRSIAELYGMSGVKLWRVNPAREAGWMELKEMLKPYNGPDGVLTARLKIFNNCRNLIRTLPALQTDPHNSNDVAREPHELTHAPDALRYMISGRPAAKMEKPKEPHYDFNALKPKPKPGRGGKIKPI